MKKPYKPQPGEPQDLCRAVFRIPNDDEGHEFLRLANKFLNRPQFNLRTRGRGKRRGVKHASHHGIAFSRGESGAVYIYRMFDTTAVFVTCTNCGGNHHSVKYTHNWKTEKLCRRCESGQQRKQKWIRSHYRAGVMV